MCCSLCCVIVMSPLLPLVFEELLHAFQNGLPKLRILLSFCFRGVMVLGNGETGGGVFSREGVGNGMINAQEDLASQIKATSA